MLEPREYPQRRHAAPLVATRRMARRRRRTSESSVHRSSSSATSVSKPGVERSRSAAACITSSRLAPASSGRTAASAILQREVRTSARARRAWTPAPRAWFRACAARRGCRRTALPTPGPRSRPRRTGPFQASIRESLATGRTRMPLTVSVRGPLSISGGRGAGSDVDVG